MFVMRYLLDSLGKCLCVEKMYGWQLLYHPFKILLYDVTMKTIELFFTEIGSSVLFEIIPR